MVTIAEVLPPQIQTKSHDARLFTAGQQHDSSSARSALLHCRFTSAPPRLPIKSLWSTARRISMSAPFFHPSVCPSAHSCVSRLHVKIQQKCWDGGFFFFLLCSSSSLSFISSASFLLCLCSALPPLSEGSFPFSAVLSSLQRQCHAPIGWPVSFSQGCHHCSPTGLMLIYTHHWSPKQR